MQDGLGIPEEEQFGLHPCLLALEKHPGSPDLAQSSTVPVQQQFAEMQMGLLLFRTYPDSLTHS